MDAQDQDEAEPFHYNSQELLVRANPSQGTAVEESKQEDDGGSNIMAALASIA